MKLYQTFCHSAVRCGCLHILLLLLIHLLLLLVLLLLIDLLLLLLLIHLLLLFILLLLIDLLLLLILLLLGCRLQLLTHFMEGQVCEVMCSLRVCSGSWKVVKLIEK